MWTCDVCGRPCASRIGLCAHRKSHRWRGDPSTSTTQSIVLVVNNPGVCFPKADNPDHIGVAVKPDHPVTVVDNLSGLISRVGRWVGLMQRLCNNASVGRYAIKIKFQSRARNEISWELTFLLAAVILKGVLAGGYPYISVPMLYILAWLTSITVCSNLCVVTRRASC